jgi:hypothetical protein
MVMWVLKIEVNKILIKINLLNIVYNNKKSFSQIVQYIQLYHLDVQAHKL